jgi:hypothetical protein
VICSFRFQVRKSITIVVVTHAVPYSSSSIGIIIILYRDTHLSICNSAHFTLYLLLQNQIDDYLTLVVVVDAQLGIICSIVCC